MAKLNFYDTDAVKAFVLNILVENQELRAEVKAARDGRDFWLKKNDETVEALSAAQAANDAAKAVLNALKDTMDAGPVTEAATLDTITKALTILEGGETK